MDCLQLLKVVKERLTLHGRLNIALCLLLPAALLILALVLSAYGLLSRLFVLELCAFSAILALFLFDRLRTPWSAQAGDAGRFIDEAIGAQERFLTLATFKVDPETDEPPLYFLKAQADELAVKFSPDTQLRFSAARPAKAAAFLSLAVFALTAAVVIFQRPLSASIAPEGRQLNEEQAEELRRFAEESGALPESLRSDLLDVADLIADEGLESEEVEQQVEDALKDISDLQDEELAALAKAKADAKKELEKQLEKENQANDTPQSDQRGAKNQPNAGEKKDTGDSQPSIPESRDEKTREEQRSQSKQPESAQQPKDQQAPDRQPPDQQPPDQQTGQNEKKPSEQQQSAQSARDQQQSAEQQQNAQQQQQAQSGEKGQGKEQKNDGQSANGESKNTGGASGQTKPQAADEKKDQTGLGEGKSDGKDGKESKGGGGSSAGSAENPKEGNAQNDSQTSGDNENNQGRENGKEEKKDGQSGSQSGEKGEQNQQDGKSSGAKQDGKNQSQNSEQNGSERSAQLNEAKEKLEQIQNQSEQAQSGSQGGKQGGGNQDGQNQSEQQSQENGKNPQMQQGQGQGGKQPQTGKQDNPQGPGGKNAKDEKDASAQSQRGEKGEQPGSAKDTGRQSGSEPAADEQSRLPRENEKQGSTKPEGRAERTGSQAKNSESIRDSVSEKDPTQRPQTADPNANAPRFGNMGGGKDIGQAADSKEKVQVEVPQEEKLIVRSLGSGDNRAYLNKPGAKARTELVSSDFVKPESETAKSSQPIPVEYQDLLR